MPVLLPLLLSLACLSAPVPEGDAARPDIVLVSIDSLRKDHLSAYGYERNTSPFIDSLADAGVRFTGARSPSSWTLPSHTTLFSGQSSVRHQVIEESLSVDPQTPLVTESLARAGYQAGGFVSATFVSRLFGFDRGFARFEDYGLHTEKNNLDASLGAARIVDDALKWWKDQAGSPVFLFLHFYDAHFEYAPPPPHDSLFDRPVLPEDLAYKSYFHHKEHPLSAAELAHQVAQYDEGIHYVDTELRRLKTALDAAGREAIWIITSAPSSWTFPSSSPGQAFPRGSGTARSVCGMWRRHSPTLSGDPVTWTATGSRSCQPSAASPCPSGAWWRRPRASRATVSPSSGAPCGWSGTWGPTEPSSSTSPQTRQR